MPDRVKRRIVHRATAVDGTGQVSALCFKRPRAIDLRRAAWTVGDATVTCPRCCALLQAMHRARAVAPTVTP